MAVDAIGGWSSNAELMAEVAELGYLDGSVLDATFGLGRFWTAWRPVQLTTNDLRTEAQLRADFRALPFRSESFDAVVYDPPYRMSGRRLGSEFDQRYGLEESLSNRATLELLVAGALECLRVSRRFLLVKCQDQVNGKAVVWQTDLVTQAMALAGAPKIDRFELLSRSPNGAHASRRQWWARRNHSSLLVFKRRGASRWTPGAPERSAKPRSEPRELALFEQPTTLEV